MKSDEIRLGSGFALGVAILYLVVGINYILRPEPGTVEETMSLLANAPAYHYIETLGFTLIGALFIAVISALTRLLEPFSPGLVRWGAAIGYVGCAGSIMSNLRMLTLVPLRAGAFLQGDALMRAAIQYNWIGNSLDPAGWLQFGAIGFWLLVVGWAALREAKRFPRAYGYLTLVGAGFNFLMLASNLFAPLIGPIVFGLSGLIVGPLWAAWTGVLLGQHAHAPAATAAATDGPSRAV